MVLVDTSVLINFFRGRETEGTVKLDRLLDEEAEFPLPKEGCHNKKHNRPAYCGNSHRA